MDSWRFVHVADMQPGSPKSFRYLPQLTENWRAAQRQIRAAAPVESVAVKPDGPDAEAPAYLNTVALVTTRLAPSVLLSYLHAIEARHGRERRERWGDRTLDLDLIAYGDVQSTDPALLVPHPRAAERDFVLEPWLAVDRDAVLPGAGRVDELLARLRAGDGAASAEAPGAARDSADGS